MKKLANLLIIITLGSTVTMAQKAETLKDVLGKYFLIGAAVDTGLVNGNNEVRRNIVTENFNSIVAENCMKGEEIHPEEHRYAWDDADRTMKFAEDNGLTITGHCLVWHSQPPKWMFTDSNGKFVSRAVLIDRMYHHITDVMGRYKGRIKGWDVVNEAVEDDGSMRKTHYYNIIGPDYIELAFKFAHEADPDAELYINDYSMAKPAKRATYLRIIKELRDKGCRIDGIGMQAHNGVDYPNLTEFEKTIDAYAATGLKVMFTELDLNMLPNPESFGGAEISQNFNYRDKLDPYRKGLDKKGQKIFEDRYLAFFEIFARHHKDISRITLWGVDDKHTWLNNFPVHGRTNYSLLFDRDYKAKPVVKKIIKMFKGLENKD